MKRDCLNCGQKEMVHTVRDVPYTYKGHDTVIPMVKGWHCFHCGVRIYGVRLSLLSLFDAFVKNSTVPLCGIIIGSNLY